MERIDSIHSTASSSNTDETPKPPKPILINTPPTPSHQSRRSISGIDILNGLKIMANNGGPQQDNIPASPVPSSTTQPGAASLISEHQFSQIDDFDIKEAIGYGSSAIVYKAIYKPFNKKMALKMIDLDKFERNQIDELRRETALMALSKHPNVLRVYGSFVHGSKLYIVTPFLAGGSCLDIMKTRFPDGLDEFSIATILKQTLEALVYLHKNGHIHRDVKAGNLLVDEDGTVLLGDFGVSSSLMETGERGMRKTFVGTPCWMAPEVMEQAEYDYKADIWSFGITAIELATGHAPFAKYPPLKVLMMTLSNDPPTLDREGTIHKYSKSFKEMIDMCLSKDPTKRPNAEKLLLHPFFKQQTKRKDYLQKVILSELPPLEQRPRTKKIPNSQIITITKQDQDDLDEDEEWDFDDNIETSNVIIAPDQQPQEKKMPKRHISFGDDVVVQRPSSVHPTTTMSDNANATAASPPMGTPVGTPPRKSRFVIEESTTTQDTYHSFNSPSVGSSSPMPEDQPPPVPSIIDSHHNGGSSSAEGEVMKGRFYVNAAATAPITTTSTTKPVTFNDTPIIHHSPHPHHSSPPSVTQEEAGHPLYKVSSHDMLSVSYSSNGGDKKSRFEIYQPVPLSRETSSNGSSTYLSSSKPPGPPLPLPPTTITTTTISTAAAAAVVEKRPPQAVDLTTENIALLTESSRKIGRFELTGGSPSNSVVDGATPRGSISSGPLNPSTSPLLHTDPQHTGGYHQSHLSVDSTHSLASGSSSQQHYQIEELIRLNEQQRIMLQELSLAFVGGGNKKSISFESAGSGSEYHYFDNHPLYTASATTPDDLSNTVDHLNSLIQQTLKENTQLQKENEALRRELKDLKLNTTTSSSSTSSHLQQ